MHKETYNGLWQSKRAQLVSIVQNYYEASVPLFPILSYEKVEETREKKNSGTVCALPKHTNIHNMRAKCCSCISIVCGHYPTTAYTEHKLMSFIIEQHQNSKIKRMTAVKPTTLSRRRKRRRAKGWERKSPLEFADGARRVRKKKINQNNTERYRSTRVEHAKAWRWRVIQ